MVKTSYYIIINKVTQYQEIIKESILIILEIYGIIRIKDKNKISM
jgi:hypothetical protein